MALSRGMTALRAALGAVGGGLEGYAQFQALEQKRKREEEAASLQREMTRFNALQAAGARFELPRQTPDAAARSATALEMPEMPGPMTAAGQQSMLGRALQAGMGVSKAPTGGLDTPIQLALDTTRTRQFERGAAMQPAVPGERIKIGGLELAVRSAETAEEKAARELGTRRRELELTQEFDDKRLNNERERMRGVWRATYPKATPGQIEALVSGVKADDIGLEILTPSQQRAEARQNQIDALDRRYKLAQITSLEDKSNTGKPLTPAELARLSEAESNALDADAKMLRIEDRWLKDKPQIGALDVGSVQELMEGKGISLSKAVASVWGSSVNPFSTDPNTMQELQDYLSYAKMHSNAIRLIAARGGSNLLQQTEQQLANAAWAGGDVQDITRARSARQTINTSLVDALEASGVATKLRSAEERRKFNNNTPTNPLSPTGQPAQPPMVYRPGMSFEDFKSRVQQTGPRR